jgi:hypothetical protein
MARFLHRPMILPPERVVISAVQALGMMTTGLPQDMRLSLALVSNLRSLYISPLTRIPHHSVYFLVGVVAVVSTYEHLTLPEYYARGR